MAKLATDPVVYELDLVGETTGELYKGTFEFKPLLSPRDKFRADRLRRDFLGQDHADAPEGIQVGAYMVAQLAVRIVKAPDWWQARGGGLDCLDENLLVTLFEEAIRIESDTMKRLKESLPEARRDLKGLVEEARKD